MALEKKTRVTCSSTAYESVYLY